jgi:hypothetical protein
MLTTANVKQTTKALTALKTMALLQGNVSPKSTPSIGGPISDPKDPMRNNIPSLALDGAQLIRAQNTITKAHPISPGCLENDAAVGEQREMTAPEAKPYMAAKTMVAATAVVFSRP